MTGFEPLLPIAVEAASPLFKAAIEAGSARLAKASRERADDVQLTIAYLETANELMIALEAETDQILLTAMALTGTSDAATRTALLGRIDQLLHGEVMRTALAMVHGRLKELHKALEHDAERSFGRRDPADRVTAALSQLEAVIGYVGSYLTWLAQLAPASYASAPFVTKIMDVRAALEGGDDGAMVATKAREAIASRYPVAMVHSADIGKAVEALRIALR